MLAGTLVAQAAPLLASPLLARMYGPEAFGIQTLLMGVASAFAVLATCRLDLAMVLPEDDTEAGEIAALVLTMTAVLCLLLAAAAIAASSLASASGNAQLQAWLWMLPLMVGVTAFTQVCVAFASRRRSFPHVAAANVTNQLVYVAASVGVGLTGAWLQGLALAKLLGQSAGTLLLGASFATRPRQLRFPDRAAAMVLLTRYRQFLVFNTPYSLVGSIARDAPIFLFSASGASAPAGYYGLARTMLLAPTLLASNALSQVFYREAVSLKGTPRLQDLTLTLLRAGLNVGAPLFAFGAVWGDFLFATIFGSSWRTAGLMAMWLAPAAWMSVQTGWPERLFEVYLRQGVSFAVQIGSDLATAVLTALVWLLTHDAVLAIAVFAVCNVLYHHGYLAALFHVAGFSAARLVGALATGWGLFALSTGALAALRLVAGPELAVMALSLFCALALALVLGLRARRSARQPAPLTSGTLK
jgi:O-antigen/teichoic acid export membrane protein